MALYDPDDLDEVRMETGLLVCVDQSIDHPLHDELVRQRRTSRERLIPPKCMTELHKKSLQSVVIVVLMYLHLLLCLLIYFCFILLQL